MFFFPDPEQEENGMGCEGRDYWEAQLSEYWDSGLMFHRSCGLPPKQYISLRRISRAKYLLWRTKLSVKEIAEQCGYENKYFFYRIFKKYTGVTPRQYRRNGNAD